MEYLRKTLYNNILGDIFKLSVGNIISQVIPVIASIIIARLYTPEDMGNWGVFASISAIIAVVITGRYELAIVLPKQKSDAYTLFNLGLIIILFISILLLIFVTSASHFNFGNSIFKENKTLLFFIPFYTMMLGINQLFLNLFNREKLYGRIATSNILRSLLQATSRIGLGLLKFSNFGLIIGAIVGVFSQFIFFTWVKGKNFVKELNGVFVLNEIKRLANSYINFPKFELFSALFNSFSVNIPVLLLAYYFSKENVGYYALAMNVLALPITFLGNAVGQVYFRSANEFQVNNKPIADITYRYFKNLFFIGILPIGALLVKGETLFCFIMGEKWIVSGTYSSHLSLWLLMVLCTAPLSYVFIILGKQKLNMIFNFIMFASRVLVVYIGGTLFKDANITIKYFGIVGFIIWLSYSFYVLKLAKVNFSTKVFKEVSIMVTLIIILVILRGWLS